LLLQGYYRRAWVKTGCGGAIYGITDKCKIGRKTNMPETVDILMTAGKVTKI
jgi:hypothetical protein